MLVTIFADLHTLNRSITIVRGIKTQQDFLGFKVDDRYPIQRRLQGSGIFLGRRARERNANTKFDIIAQEIGSKLRQSFSNGFTNRLCETVVSRRNVQSTSSLLCGARITENAYGAGVTNLTIMKSAEIFRSPVGPNSSLNIAILLSRRNEGMRLLLRAIFHSMSKLTTTKALHDRNVRERRNS